MGKSKGVISEQEWNSGVNASGDSEKAAKVVVVLEKVGKGGMNMVQIGLESGLKWPYSTVQTLLKAGTLEKHKVGKANYFRVRKATKAKSAQR